MEMMKELLSKVKKMKIWKITKKLMKNKNKEYG